MEMLSTYRLQFHKGFTFRDASEIVPYLHELGITHVYASPYLKAVAGSTHGYDVIDHSQLNPEIGSEEEYRHFVSVLADHGMSHILDTVPNHMGVDTNDNPWWNDVLAHGRDSRFGNFFDIDWDQFPPRPQLLNKVLLPVLGEPYGEVLKKQQLQVTKDEKGWFVSYFDRRFPIDPKSKTDSELSELLDQQHYRLSYWRVAPDEINYRRFFDVTSLAGLQMQRQEVFDAAHDFTFQLIAKGHVTGLRVDHPDGLLDPKQYFERLQEKFRKQCPTQAADEKPLYVSVEKILNGEESLRKDWAVAGTSGYDFLCAVNDLFVDPENEQQLTEIYTAFINDHAKYADIVYEKKCLILDTSLISELTSLTSRLDALAQLSNTSRDFTRRQLREALRVVIACFSVYRSYVSAQGVDQSDADVVQHAVDDAAGRNPHIALDILNFIGDSVLLRYSVPANAGAHQLEFAQRFQQLTSPVNAKGIEDTTFYIYNRLTSLNEVGGDPGRFGRNTDALHRYFLDRCNNWPAALSALSTHDTKRSEDVRARISVLSEIPAEWGERLDKWRQLNGKLCQSVHPNDQYLLYQTLVGAWPFESMDETSRQAFVQRINSYMQKAMREAKQRTAWTAVNANYENAVAQLVEDLIDPKKSGKFLHDFVPFQKTISRAGLFNSLSQTVIRVMAPGVPDTYQGSEAWDLSLVDPDNRRPVDYRHRQQLLSELSEATARELLANIEDSRIKLWITSKLLHLRKQLPDVFNPGRYEAIHIEGERRQNIFAFSRTSRTQSVLVVVPRLISRLEGVENKWADTKIILPDNLRAKGFVDIFTNEYYPAEADGSLAVSSILGEFPIAVLISK